MKRGLERRVRKSTEQHLGKEREGATERKRAREKETENDGGKVEEVGTGSFSV